MTQVRRCPDGWIKEIEAISLPPSITIDDGANPYNETSIGESGAKKQAGSRIGQNWGSWASKREHEINQTLIVRNIRRLYCISRIITYTKCLYKVSNCAI